MLLYQTLMSGHEREMAYDTDGSNLIKEKLLDNNDAPIYLETWGGCNTIARALKSIEDEYKGTAQWDSIYQKVSKKAVLYNIMDQDDTYKTYISRVWPDIKVWYNSEQFFSLAYIWKDVVPEEQRPYFRGPWMQKGCLQKKSSWMLFRKTPMTMIFWIVFRRELA